MVEHLDKITYTLANPVLSFLVEEGEDWPGVRRVWPAPPKVIKRPEYQRWRAGERDVVFPYGTNKMSRLHGVRVAPRPS